MPLTPFKIGSLTIPHRLVLAPMCGITHFAFRKVCKEYEAGLVINQMISARALVMGDKKSHDMLKLDDGERPVGLQLFGNNADDLEKAAAIAQEAGADLVDLNMGCPVKKIVNDGGGSALLTNLILVKDILSRMRKALTIPFTVKMRAGWDDRCLQAFDVAKVAQDCGVDAIAIHARTREQGYSGQANWDIIRDLKEKLSIPVIGNGDVETFEDANRMMQETGCDAVMTGRGASQEPWIFKSFVDQKEFTPTPSHLKELVLRQYEYFFQLFGVESGLKQMRKHLCLYSKGFHGGSEFRNKVVRLSDWNELKKTVEAFYDNAVPGSVFQDPSASQSETLS